MPDSAIPDLRAQVAELPWYHTIELPGGVVTPGEYDHRAHRDRVLLPRSLDGLRCLDVGTHDGFWAFELERRGAAVVAIDVEHAEDIDWPSPRPPVTDEMRAFLVRRKQAFFLARKALGSRVEHRYTSIYDVPQELDGAFDLVFIGTLLHHLRDPMRALDALRQVTRGQLLLVGTVDLATSLLRPGTPLTRVMELPYEPFWELPNIAGLRGQLTRTGWEIVEKTRPHLQRHGAGHPWQRPGLRPLRSLPTRFLHATGAPHVAILARPVGEHPEA